MADAPSIFTAHQDADLFRGALRFTAARTGFVARLIEKHYFCTLAAADLRWRLLTRKSIMLR